MSQWIAARRARLHEYVPWIFRDYAMNQGPSTLIVVLLIGFMSVLPVMSSGAAVGVGERVHWRELPGPVAANLLRAIVPPLVFLGTFFATNGIIANDRKMGFYRFLFAKPVSPPWYYALTFAVYGAGLLTVCLLVLGLWSLVVRPMFPVELFAVVALMYLAYGGIGFLLSAAWRFDWLSLVTVLLTAYIGWATWGDSTGVVFYLLHLLPPVHKEPQIYALIASDGARAFPWRAVAWLGGYGLTCFVLGLVVVRRRSLGTS